MKEPRPPVWVDVATADDVDAVLAIESRSYPEPWSRRQFKGALAGEAGQKVLALRSAQRLVGYAVLQVVVDELHVHNVAVEPELRGRGLGRALLGVVLRWAENRGCREAWLEVRRSNAAALALYAAAGFEPAGVRKGYYGHPREDAIVLKRRARNDH